MPIAIKLSEKTKKLVNELRLASPAADDLLLSDSYADEINTELLITWLNKKTNTNTFIRESLRAALLTDLMKGLPGELYEHKSKESSTTYKKGLYILLAIAGTLFLGCEGFDGITSVLSLFSLSHGFILAVGGGFSILSIAVFYGFDLLEISNNLGVSFSESRSVLDVYLQQLEQVALISEKLNLLSVGGTLKSKEKLDEYLNIIGALQAQLVALEETRKKFESALNHKGLRAAKMGFALVTGVMFFAGGFFAGHTVALTIASAIVGSAVASTAWPVVVVALFIACAAFMIYWFVERPGVQNLIGRFVGLDKEKVQKFSDEKGIDAVKFSLDEAEKFYTEAAQKAAEKETRKVSSKLGFFGNTEKETAVVTRPNSKEGVLRSASHPNLSFLAEHSSTSKVDDTNRPTLSM